MSSPLSEEARFVHERHKPPKALDRPREMIVACPPMRSNVNLSRLVRAASCCGISKVIACGNARLLEKISRDGAIELETHRTLSPVLRGLHEEGYEIVGLEQTTHSECLHEFTFQRKTVLVIGHERTGLSEEILRLLDHVVEIPVWGKPYSHNAATAAAIGMYEYCRQFPVG